MEHVVRSVPAKLLFGKNVQVARSRLIEIDRAKANVKGADARLNTEQNAGETDDSKRYVKNVVGRCTAGEAFVFGNDKAEDADNDQQRRKN